MSTDAWTIGLAAASLLVAVIALVFSARAVRHAKDSNRIATEAVELERRRESRHMEFRDVRWELVPSMRTMATHPLFVLRNVGTTDAHQVSLVFTVDEIDRRHLLRPLIRAGEKVQIDPTALSGVERLKTLVNIQHEGVRVHWTSASGEPGEWRSPTLQMF